MSSLHLNQVLFSFECYCLHVVGTKFVCPLASDHHFSLTKLCFNIFALIELKLELKTALS